MDNPSELVPLPLACQELRVSQKRGYELVTSGRLVASRGENQRWYVTRAAIERYQAEQAALESGDLTGAQLAAMNEAAASLSDTAKRLVGHMIGLKVNERALEADRAEAISRGNLPLADAITDMLVILREGTVTWNGTRWVLNHPKLGTVESSPVPA